MATLDSDVPMVPVGESSSSAAPSSSSKKPKRFEIKKWSAALSAKQIRPAPLVRSAQLLGEFATMHSIFIASADGLKLVKFVHWTHVFCNAGRDKEDVLYRASGDGWIKRLYKNGYMDT
ncbi:putative ring-box protein [Tripterygium wilfordii]|uniref:Putative ring-box protein n=1 Tax=Tripterygium wilfordii TaxID=458696 RepID=A0A7J7BW27_TRIWF|nr:putative ring-box protein [Tripterygium wilfordii]